MCVYRAGKVCLLGLADLPLVELTALEPRITGAVYDALEVERSVASRASYGGTAPERVATTGTPAAMASTGGMPKPSSQIGANAKTSAS